MEQFEQERPYLLLILRDYSQWLLDRGYVEPRVPDPSEAAINFLNEIEGYLAIGRS